MYGWDTLVLLRHLLEQGLSKTAIAARLGVSRRVDLRLDRRRRAGSARRGRRRRPAARPAPLRPAADQARRLHQHHRRTPGRATPSSRPCASSPRSAPPATPAASRSSTTYVRRRAATAPSRSPSCASRRRPGTRRRSTSPSCRLPWGKRYALLVVLGYSRLLWLRFYPRQTMRSVVARAGGRVPLLRRCAAGAALRPDEGGRHRRRARRPGDGSWRMPSSCASRALGLPHPRLPAVPRPDQGQGRAPDPLPARELPLRARVPGRCRSRPRRPTPGSATVANVRVHGTTREVPQVRFERDERAVLQPLAARPYRSLLLPDGARRPAAERAHRAGSRRARAASTVGLRRPADHGRAPAARRCTRPSPMPSPRR